MVGPGDPVYRGLSVMGDATAAATGYDTDEILARVLAATRAVVAGQAAFERDSVLFAHQAYSYPILAALLRAAARNGGG